MCLINSCCFPTLPPTATPSERVSHHSKKALCSFVLLILTGTLLTINACSIIGPYYTPHEIIILSLYTAACVASCARMVQEIGYAITANKERIQQLNLQG